jgi:tetratricopeptide (TPR) repeat protein
MRPSPPAVAQHGLNEPAPLPARAGKGARRRTRTIVLVLALLLLIGAGVGFYFYALRQWAAAEADVKNNRLQEAQGRINFCLWVWPRSGAVHLLAARAARLHGEFEEAEAHLNRCLKLQHGATEPVQVEFLLMRVQRGEEDEVAPELLSVYVNNNSPESALILETLSGAYMRNLRYGPAYSCLNRWAEIAPDSADPYRWRGWVTERLGNHDGALKDYQRALELNPDLVTVRLRLAEMLLDKADSPAAREHLERLRLECPDRADVLARLGQCRFMQGETEEARELLEKAVEQLPNDSALLVTLAKLYNQERRAADAEKWARRALKVDPTDTEAEVTLTASLQAQGRWDEANKVLEQFQQDTALLKRVAQVLQKEAEGHGADPDALAEVGALFLTTNERVGLYWLNQALERDPNHQLSHKALAEYYEKKGAPEKAALHRSRLAPAK